MSAFACWDDDQTYELSKQEQDTFKVFRLRIGSKLAEI